MTWLLINPTNHFLKMFPTGIAYVSASLKANGVAVQTLNLEFIPEDQVFDTIDKTLADKTLKVVGLGGLYFEFDRIRSIIEQIRRVRPDITVVVGNGVVSSDPKLMLPALGAQIGVIGEGEETVVELAQALEKATPLENIDGLAIFDESKNEVTLTQARKAIMDIDSIPIPDYEGFDIERYLDSQNVVTYYGYSYMDNPRPSPILASRSCPFKCTFCYHSIGTYRKRSMENFFAEVEMMVKKYNVNSLLIYDDLFAVKASRLVEFCEHIEKYDLKWQVSMRVQSIDDGKIDTRLLRRMKEAGCVSINLGLESVNEKILESMVKKTTKRQVETAVRMIAEADLTMQGNFIFGDTVETTDTANDTLNWWVQHKEAAIQTDPIWVFPGTPLFHQALADGHIASTEEYLNLPNPAFNVSSLDDSTFNQMKSTLAEIQNHLNRFPGTLRELEKGATHEGQQGYHITIRCPHCGHDHTFRDHAAWNRLMCRTCGGLFDVPIHRHLGWSNYSVESRRLTSRATRAYFDGNFGKAYIEARSALFDHPCNKDANFIAGTIALKAGFLNPAARFISEAIQQKSDQGHIYNNYGICLFGIGEIELALLVFRHAQLLEETIDEAVHNEAMALEALGGEEMNLQLVQAPGRPHRDIGNLKISEPPVNLDGSTVPAKAPFRPRYAAMEKPSRRDPMTGAA
ncbi:MAG: radical SAM protein [Rhodospirillaceae bacterium]|nr:radical SAM protein [Rhodospirillaceae bacterium]